jgi:hypothetical protein
MSEQDGWFGTEDGPGEDAQEGGRTRRERMAERISALKKGFEETIAEAREKGDISAEKAREMLKSAADRALEATSEARERFDFVPQQEFDALAERVARLESNLAERLGAADESL